MPLARQAGTPIDGDDVAAAVEAFHRENEEARLIEARSQEPMVRGIRLLATGLVDQPAPVVLEPQPAPATSVGERRVHTGDAWHDAPVYDGEQLRPGPPLVGPAVVQWPFTTLLLQPRDRALVRPNGDVLVDVAAGTDPAPPST
jgi:N-methylhydantoinase A